MKRVLFLCIFIFIFLSFVSPLRADDLTDITNQLNDLKKTFSAINSANQINETQLQGLQKQLDSIKSQVAVLEREIEKKQVQVTEGEKAFAIQQKLLNQRAKSYYKNMGKNSFSVVNLLLSENISESLQNYFYQKTLVDEDRKAIIRIAMFVRQVEDKKKQLEAEKTLLAAVKVDVDKQSQFLAGEVAKSKKSLGELQSKIVQLSAKQQEILSQRISSLNIPRSAGTSARGCSDDRGVDPGFSPRIAFFTYGAPHRNGLNQYGALGRAKAGQNEEQILSEYYPGMSLKKDYDQNTPISTNTGWSGSIEDYVKRIYEVPDSWTDNNLAVLKAQAVAARTYALSYKIRAERAGRDPSICTNEGCQVFKSDAKGGNWEQAVIATAGWVLFDGGDPGFTQYASTHGGYVLNLGKFDGRDGNPGSFSDLNDRAYDKESPWFYCDWGARSSYSNTAWLKPEEVVDIANTLLLIKRDSSTAENLYQVDKPNPAGKETWNFDKVKEELQKKGGTSIGSISDISVSADFGSGKSTTVTINGQSFSASEFKDRFNLRAPANIQIVGPLFNVEKR